MAPAPSRRWIIWKGYGLAILLLGAGAPVTAHEPVLLDPHRATPGARLELEAVPAPVQGGDTPVYRLVAAGLPSGVVFNVWTKRFGHAFHEEARGFRVDGSGKLVSIQRGGADAPRYLDQMVFQPEAYPRGAIWEVALASADLTITAFAKVIPRPIVARDGACEVSLKLVSHRGERFLVSGSGFAPGDVVIVESRYLGRVNQKERRASAAGLLPAEVISHAALGDDRSARYSVKGRYCEVAVEYEWGEPALGGR